MIINCRTLGWCQCITVRTEKDGTKLTDLLRWQSLMFDKYDLKFDSFSLSLEIEANKGPKTRFCQNCFQPIVEPKFKTHELFCKGSAPLEIRMSIESPSVDFVSWENVFLLYMLISKQWMLHRHRFREWKAGQKKLNDSMQLVTEQSSLILEVSCFFKILGYYIFRLNVSANYRRKHFAFVHFLFLF